MQIENLQDLACPSCRRSYELKDETVVNNRIIQGILSCPACHVAVPILRGFPCFDEARPWAPGTDTSWVEHLHTEKFGRDQQYGDFLNEKARRGTSDLYAAFQPFNESTRALYPLIEILREVLQPGDLILDTWCRTGWSGELLAGLFPEQRVISVWEGDSNVLGYKGFDYWLKEGHRAENLDLIFAHPDRALPIQTNSVRVLHGLDSLHRYQQSSFIGESLRVCKEDGILVFPHIHMTNNEPEPFFIRGCHQYHGKDWKAWLDSILLDTTRSGWVLPEVELFEEKTGYPLTDRSHTPHYNGLVLIADRKYEGRLLTSSSHRPVTEDCRLIMNPLLKIDLDRGTAALDPDGLGGLADELLSRHPCYAQRLALNTSITLSADDVRLIWHACQGKTIAEIAGSMSQPHQQVIDLAHALCQQELVHAAPVTQAMVDLQQFYGFATLPSAHYTRFKELWESAVAGYGERPILHWLEDGSELFSEDLSFLVQGIRCALFSNDILAGNRIAVVTDHHPEAALLAWAAWLSGVITVFINVSEPPERIQTLLASSRAQWLFTDQQNLLDEIQTKAVLFDDEDTQHPNSFSNWLEPCLEEAPPHFEGSPDDDAVILFTSGTTGEPKGVVLSQRAICLSGINMARRHGWHQERILSLGPLSMMSGLRNPLIASLASSSTVLLPNSDTTKLPLCAWDNAVSQSASVITSVPAWLGGLISASTKLAPAPLLRQILVTGAPLRAELRHAAETLLGVTIGSYYGLTESGGICVVSLDETENPRGSIGTPSESVIQIVDASGATIQGNDEGVLKVYSDQLMSRYLDDPESTERTLKKGWLVTGDLARRDESGHVWLCGRADEMLNLRNGLSLHPQALEEALLALPGVSDAAVTLTEDNQELVALVVSNTDVDLLQELLSKKVSAGIAPHRIHKIDVLPTGRNGKLVRARLSELVFK